MERIASKSVSVFPSNNEIYWTRISFNGTKAISYNLLACNYFVQGIISLCI